MSEKLPILFRVLRDFSIITGLSLQEWDLLLRQARYAGLLGRIAVQVEKSGWMDDLPPQVQRHLMSERVLANRQRESAIHEVAYLMRAFERIQEPLILLKGAAYVMSDNPAGEGRFFSDTDVIVPKARIETVERALFLGGWLSSHLDAYDQQYYRRWMHELPPMYHRERKTTLDLHHTILPPTSKNPPDAALLIEAARPVPNRAGIRVLAPTDMVLHSAAHLFAEGELEHGLRDLVDLDSLFRHFSEHEPGFWDALLPRAKQLHLERPLYYAVRYCTHLLGTPVPENVIKNVGSGRAGWMDFFFFRVLRPYHKSCDLPGVGFARWGLYVRSHYLRMPLYLLLPHLARKAWKQRVTSKKDEF